jgi:hypothetical protein
MVGCVTLRDNTPSESLNICTQLLTAFVNLSRILLYSKLRSSLPQKFLRWCVMLRSDTPYQLPIANCQPSTVVHLVKICCRWGDGETRRGDGNCSISTQPTDLVPIPYPLIPIPYPTIEREFWLRSHRHRPHLTLIRERVRNRYGSDKLG